MRKSVLILAAIWLGGAQAADKQVISLTHECPPSFELVEDGTCALRTLYDLYDSPDGHGGFKAKLPSTKLDRRFTPQQIDLGRYLFFDPILSTNKDMACASCHQPNNGLADGHGQSLGAMHGDGSRAQLTRGAPTLWNVAYLKRLMLDGRFDNLIQQAGGPLFAPDEMGNDPKRLVSDVTGSSDYLRLFDEAFGQKPSVENISTALAAFESSLVSFNSRYDRYVHGQHDALSEQEVRGYNTFRGFVARCSQCHIPPLFTDSELAVIGSPNAKGQPFDKGAGAFSTDKAMLGAYRVPTLRNISRTAPYFHAGQFKTLEDTAAFYNDTRGHAAPAGVDLKIHWHVHMTDGPKLSDKDVEAIAAFLMALEDETMLPPIPAQVPSGLRPTTTFSSE